MMIKSFAKDHTIKNEISCKEKTFTSFQTLIKLFSALYYYYKLNINVQCMCVCCVCGNSNFAIFCHFLVALLFSMPVKNITIINTTTQYNLHINFLAPPNFYFFFSSYMHIYTFLELRYPPHI